MKEIKRGVGEIRKKKGSILVFHLASFLMLPAALFTQIGWVAILFAVIHFGFWMYVEKKDYERVPMVQRSFEKPENLNPIIAGYLLKEQLEINDIFSGFLYLVNKKVLHLTREGEFVLGEITEQKMKSLDDVDLYLLEAFFISKDRSSLHKDDLDYILRKEFNKDIKIIDNYDNIYRLLYELEKIARHELRDCFDDEAKQNLHRIHKWVALIQSALILLQLNGIAIFIGVIYVAFSWASINHSIQLVKIKTRRGKRRMQHWMYHKEFLENNIRAKEKKLKDILLWDEYITYSVAFGVAKNILKRHRIYPIQYQEMHICDGMLTTVRIEKNGNETKQIIEQRNLEKEINRNRKKK